VSSGFLSHARTVLCHSRDAADAGLAGTLPLNVAYNAAVKARQVSWGRFAQRHKSTGESSTE
jgi:hypothetical protein